MGNAAAVVATMNRDQQLELLDELWASLGRDPQALPLSPEQRRDLDERLDELEREGPVGQSWDEVVAQIRARR
jgi:putative addiction module component (TIGR02574 family)